MILAHWLSYPPDRYQRLVESITGSPIFLQMSRQIEVIQFTAAVSPSHGSCTQPCGACPEGTTARLVPVETGLNIAYCHPAWGKEFWVNGEPPTTGSATDHEVDWLLRRLRLINSRNRLTHLILHAAAEAQADFLHSGRLADLKRLTQRELCHQLVNCSRLTQRFLAPGPGLETVDTGMISRAVRGLTVCTPQGQQVTLRQLLPSSQALLRYRLLSLLDEEAVELKRGGRRQPQNDSELRRQVAAHWGQNVSRRTISAARQALGIPPWHQRAGRPIYPLPAFNFSSPHTLTTNDVRAHVPAGPGVYEISMRDQEYSYPFRGSPVVYLGRSQNLRSRLRSYLYKRDKFGRTPFGMWNTFRITVVGRTHLAQAEAQLMQAFFDTHGALPLFNTNMPSGAGLAQSNPQIPAHP